MTANVVAPCMQHVIDLLILPLHCSHDLQPLDAGVFSLLKRVLAAETETVAQLGASQVSRRGWAQTYVRARQKASTAANTKSGRRSTGREPLSPVEALDKRRPATTSAPSSPYTPAEIASLDLTFLDSSPPDGTEVRKAMALFSLSRGSLVR
jgi:hypothetical protein